LPNLWQGFSLDEYRLALKEHLPEYYLLLNHCFSYEQLLDKDSLKSEAYCTSVKHDNLKQSTDETDNWDCKRTARNAAPRCEVMSATREASFQQ